MPDQPDEPKTPATLLCEARAESAFGQLSLRVLPSPVKPLLAKASPPVSAVKPALSPRMRNKVLRFADAVEARRDETQLLAFSPEDFIRFGLPYKRFPGSEYERRNGGMRYRITSVPEYGVPFGQDRLLPIWLASAYAVCGQPESGVIQFRSVRDILLAFGLPTGGSKHLALKESLLRLTHATLFVYDERQRDTKGSGERYALRRYNLIDAVDLWFDKQGKQPNQYSLWQNFITLSRSFADSLRQKVMPLDLGTVRALKNNPMALDLYIWQAHRSWELRQKRLSSVGVPVFGAEGLLAQLGTQVVAEKKARQLIRTSQALVEGVWRGCPNHLTQDGNRLVLRPAEDLKDARLELPGVSSRPPVSRLLAAVGDKRLQVSRPPVDVP